MTARVPTPGRSLYNGTMPYAFFNEMKNDVGFDDRDTVNLRSLAEPLAPILNKVADRFHHRMVTKERARYVFRGGPNDLEEQRKQFGEWLRELFSGHYDRDYYRRISLIGQAHVETETPQHYILTGMELVCQELDRAVNEAQIPDAHEKMKSLRKLLLLELAVILEAYKDSYSSRIRQEERTVAEEKLTRSEHLAQLGQLAASLAHEIKNPLAGISGAIQVIRDGMKDEDPHRRIIWEILGQIHRLDAAVEDLLVYARPKAPELCACELDGIIDHVLRVNRDALPLRRCRLEVEKEGVLPRVLADPHQIEQMVLNLLFNAAHASQDDDTLRIRLSQAGGCVRMVIADTGCGMNEETAARAFEPFFTTKAKGTGLGLPICRKIVEAHHGMIALNSRPGMGTEVTVELPIGRNGGTAKVTNETVEP